MRISILRTAFLAACLATGALDAQAADSAGLLSVDRIAALPAAERLAWEGYVETSWRLAEIDRALLAAELRAAGRTEPIPTMPGGNFALEEGIEAPEWCHTEAARQMADAIVSYQMPSGGWSRLADLTRGPRRPGQSYVAEEDGVFTGTFVERATTHHMRFLATADRVRADAGYRRAFLRGLEYIFTAQFPNGCWPRGYPLQGGHHDAAAFSDGTIVDILRLLRDVARGDFAFVDGEARRRVEAGLARGVGCTVRGQVVVDGRRTGWAPEHDPLTLAPVDGPEPAALSGQHGSAILWFLMQLDPVDPHVAAAVRGGVGWVRETMLWGWHLPYVEKPEPRVGAGPVWARYYEIGSNRPLFVWGDTIAYNWRPWADSTGGYTWFNPYPEGVLTQYEAWSRKHAAPLPPVELRWSAVVDARYTGRDGEMQHDSVPWFRTIGAALAAAPADAREPFVIAVRDGRYREKLSIQKPNIHLVGQSRDGTVLTYDVAAGHLSPGGWPYGTRGSWTLHVAAPGFRLERMTVENAFDFMANAAKADSDSTKLRGTQAVAVMLDEGSDRAVFRDCRLSGHQDTLFPNSGRSYFHRCEILGSVDFIFGAGRAVFDDCDIVSRDRGSADNNGYVTAPSTPIAQPYGLLFVGCRLKKETPSMAPNSVTLGRPWHPSGRPDAIGSAVFIGTWMDDHVGARGWSPMTSTDAAGHRVEHQPQDARFFEHGTTGPGAVASPSRRVLTPEQAAEYSILRVLDGWDPRQ